MKKKSFLTLNPSCHIAIKIKTVSLSASYLSFMLFSYRKSIENITISIVLNMIGKCDIDFFCLSELVLHWEPEILKIQKSPKC